MQSLFYVGGTNWKFKEYFTDSLWHEYLNHEKLNQEATFSIPNSNVASWLQARNTASEYLMLYIATILIPKRPPAPGPSIQEVT